MRLRLASLCIEAEPGLQNSRSVLARPTAKCTDRPQEGATELGQLVVDARGDGGKYRTGDKAVPFNPRNVNVSMRCEMLAIERRSSLNRFGPSPSVTTTSTLHLSPMRSRTSLTARQSSGTSRVLGDMDVRSCLCLTGIYLASVSNEN